MYFSFVSREMYNLCCLGEKQEVISAHESSGKWKCIQSINRRIAFKTNALSIWTPVTSGYDSASEVTPYGCCMHGCRVERTSEAVWYWSRMHLFSQQPRIFWTWKLIQFNMTPPLFLFHKFMVLQTDNNTIMNTIIWNRKNSQITVEFGYVMKGAECFVSL